ncbi:MAG: PEP-CTERM sorting domain-containing protein [Roseibacillus sp.]
MPPTIRSALSLCAIFFALSHGAIAQELPQHHDDPIVVPGSSGNSSTEESPETSAAPEPSTTLLAGLGGLALLFFSIRRK